MRPIILIPARYASTRLPGKPMADIHGKPMILHVWERAIASGLGPVVVATDYAGILEAVTAAGGIAVMTREDHPSGSDRIWEALSLADPEGKHDIIINLQGDLPTLDPALIGLLAGPFTDLSIDITTLAVEITSAEDRVNPAIVKPVVAWDAAGKQGRALYFSRATLPHGEGACFHHIGLYAYRRSALERFVSLPPSPLEVREKLEQLRALEHGMRIEVLRVETHPLGVDTLEQLEQARSELR